MATVLLSRLMSREHPLVAPGRLHEYHVDLLTVSEDHFAEPDTGLALAIALSPGSPRIQNDDKASFHLPCWPYY